MTSSIGRAFVLALFLAPAQLAIAQNTMRLRLENIYMAHLNLGFGSATRAGIDSVNGALTLQADGTWTGVVDARVKFTQELKGLGVVVCPSQEFIITQRLAMVATAVPGFNTETQLITYRSGRADGGFLALEVKPVTRPSIPPGECLDMHNDVPDDPNIIPLLPLNDARWTNPPTAGYVIGLPRSGVLAYVDGTLPCDPDETGRGLNPACSQWSIRVERP